jgi:hypothetical protein
MPGVRTASNHAGLADFGMAVPYFVEIVELNEVTVACGPQIAHSEIGQAFGDQTVIVTGVTRDGQAWRVIYPNETSRCWITTLPAWGRATNPHGF